MKTINEKGLAAIAQWLAEKHKRPADVAGREGAWASDAEQSMLNGNPPLIEIRAWDAVSGHTECFRVPDECIDGEDEMADDE